jgi:hypothetical protein
MERSTGMAVALSACLTLCGCADLMSRTQAAPAWFEAKAVEVKGEGYPSLSEVPTLRTDADTQAEWDAQGEALRAKADAIEAEAAGDPAPTADEIRARAAQLRAMTEQRAARAAGTTP